MSEKEKNLKNQVQKWAGSLMSDPEMPGCSIEPVFVKDEFDFKENNGKPTNIIIKQPTLEDLIKNSLIQKNKGV